MARTRVVVIGGGFAGYHATKRLIRLASADDTEIVLINPTDYFLYVPLLPEVAAGILEARSVSVSLPATLPDVRLVLGEVRGIDLTAHEIDYVDAENGAHRMTFDRLVLSVGSVNKMLPISGVAEYAHGFRTVPEALYLRDHLVRQLALAAATDDQVERDARCTFVVVGAGYTGTEVAAQGPTFTAAIAARHKELRGQRIRWLLLDVAPSVLPGLDRRLSSTADQVLRERGVEVRTETSISHADSREVTLDSGDSVTTRTIVWCVGVRPDPLVESLDADTEQGRLVVGRDLTVPGHPDVFACGDAAAVPDVTRQGELTAMTAQHAVRQGKLAARNVAASLGTGRKGKYRHHDLGFLVDLGAHKAAANPLGLPMSGLLAKSVTRGYHLASMPGNRVRVAAGWALDAVLPRNDVELGLVRSGAVPLDSDSPELPER
jgi:NADH dehydrogenase